MDLSLKFYIFTKSHRTLIIGGCCQVSDEISTYTVLSDKDTFFSIGATLLLVRSCVQLCRVYQKLKEMFLFKDKLTSMNILRIRTPFEATGSFLTSLKWLGFSFFIT